MFCAPMRMRDECPHVGKSVVDPGGSAPDSNFDVVSEYLIGFDQIVLDEVKVACDVRRTADAFLCWYKTIDNRSWLRAA